MSDSRESSLLFNFVKYFFPVISFNFLFQMSSSSCYSLASKRCTVGVSCSSTREARAILPSTVVLRTRTSPAAERRNPINRSIWPISRRAVRRIHCPFGIQRRPRKQEPTSNYTLSVRW